MVRSALKKSNNSPYNDNNNAVVDNATSTTTYTNSTSTSNNKQEAPIIHHHNKHQRKVYFVPARNSVCEFESIDNTDKILVQSLWQQPWEMRNCKQALKMRARQFRTTGLGILLADTFHCDSELLSVNPRLCQKQLNTLAQLPDDLYNRGIERYLCRKHDQERTTRKRSIIREVVSQARTLREHNAAAHNAISVEEQQRYLSQFSQQLNHDASVFARRMGRADEFAMRHLCQGGDAQNNNDHAHAAYQLAEYLMYMECQRQQDSRAAAGGGATAPTRRRSAQTGVAAATANQLKAAPPTQQSHAAGASVAISGRLLQARQA